MVSWVVRNCTKVWARRSSSTSPPTRERYKEGERPRSAALCRELHPPELRNAALDLDTVLQRIAEGAWELCGSERALIMQREPGGEALVSRYQEGFPQMPYTGLRIEPGKEMGAGCS